MNTYRPRKPVGTSAAWMFFKAVWDMLWGGKFPFIDTDSVKWDRSESGYAARAALPSATGKSAQFQITGEWDPARTYSASVVNGVTVCEVATITTGANIGTYYYINPTPSSGHAPYAGGGYWAQLPMGVLGTYI